MCHAAVSFPHKQIDQEAGHVLSVTDSCDAFGENPAIAALEEPHIHTEGGVQNCSFDLNSAAAQKGNRDRSAERQADHAVDPTLVVFRNIGFDLFAFIVYALENRASIIVSVQFAENDMPLILQASAYFSIAALGCCGKPVYKQERRKRLRPHCDKAHILISSFFLGIKPQSVLACSGPF